MSTDSDVEEWKAAMMDAGADAIPRRQRMRSLEHKIAIEAACVTIETECRLAQRRAGHTWWYEDALSITTGDNYLDEQTRRYVAEAIEYLDLCGLLERMAHALGPMVRIRHEDIRQ